MQQQAKESSDLSIDGNGIKILELTVGHTSWYWCHFPGEPTKIRFSFRSGILLFGGRRIPVGLNLSEKGAQQWVLNAPLEQRKRIRTVKVASEINLELLEMTPNCQVLECVGISGEAFRKLNQHFKKLKMLYVTSSGGMADLGSFAGHTPEMRRLIIADCEDLSALKGMEKLVKLQQFDLINCDNLWEIDPVGFAKSLKSIVIRNCDNIHTINRIGVLHELERLEISRCKQVRDISPLRDLANITYIDLSDCPRLTDVDVISRLKSIAELRLFGCRNVKDLRPLYHMPNMRMMSLPPNVTDDDLHMFCIAHKEKLTELDMRNCSELSDISSLSEMEKLKKLKLSGCRQLEDITALGKLASLEELDLADCAKIRDIEPLFALDNLRELFIGGCKGLDKEQVHRFESEKPECKVYNV